MHQTLRRHVQKGRNLIPLIVGSEGGFSGGSRLSERVEPVRENSTILKMWSPIRRISIRARQEIRIAMKSRIAQKLS
jgi:hypothetical protein